MKGIKILVLIVIILMIIMGLKIAGVEIIPEKMSEAEVIALIEKGQSYENLYYSYLDGDRNKTEQFVKDNIIVSESEPQNIYLWQNIDTNEKITINNNNALIEKQSSELVTISKFVCEKTIKLALDENCIFKHEKTEKINNKECAVVKIVNDEDKDDVIQLWVELETGLIICDGMFTYEYSIGTVTDEDIERPNLVGYNVINLDEQN